MSLPPIRAPREHGAVLALPPLEQADQVIIANQHSFPDVWHELRAQACRETITAAVEYLRGAGEPVPHFESAALLLAGHQPELFHPGVWVKNFALNGLARRNGHTPLNLIIDTDTAKSAALPVPVLTPENALDTAALDGNTESDPFAPLPDVSPPSPLAHLARVAFDDWNGDVPYEERRVNNQELFASFAERVDGLTRNWPFRSMLSAFWSEVQRTAQRTTLLGERFAAARRAVERRWSCANLEVPMSRICTTDAFGGFVAHLLHNLNEFHRAHNQALLDYRQQHGIVSRNRPVAELSREGDWLEAPLWAWKGAAQRRQRLFVRHANGAIELRAGAERWPNVPNDAAGFRTAWQQLAKDGYKIRSRALTTTMFARLFLGELFIHGIGGAKYDELNDEIMRRFYHIEPPRFLVLSATLLLPFPRQAINPTAVVRLALERRDRWYNPDRYLATAAANGLRDLVAERTHWLERAPASKAERRACYRELRQINHRLREANASQQLEATKRLLKARQHLEANEVLARRDFAFCLFPEESIRPFCEQFLSMI